MYLYCVSTKRLTLVALGTSCNFVVKATYYRSYYNFVLGQPCNIDLDWKIESFCQESRTQLFDVTLSYRII